MNTVSDLNLSKRNILPTLFPSHSVPSGVKWFSIQQHTVDIHKWGHDSHKGSHHAIQSIPVRAKYSFPEIGTCVQHFIWSMVIKICVTRFWY